MYKKNIPALKYLTLSENGKFIIYPESVAVIAENDQHEILIIEQYRELFNSKTLEIPGGVIEKNETIEEGAKREYLEETGFMIHNLEYISTLDMDVAITNHKTHIYFAKIDNKPQTICEDDINILWFNIETLMKYINNGQITHAPSVVSIYWYFINKKATNAC